MYNIFVLPGAPFPIGGRCAVPGYVGSETSGEILCGGRNMKLLNRKGSIEIKNDIIAVLAGYAALNCLGVKGMTARNIGDGIVKLVKGEDFHRGVKVTVNKGCIDIELHIAVDHGVNMRTVALSTMDEVRYVVEQQTGIKVGNVDVYVDAITVGDDEAED